MRAWLTFLTAGLSMWAASQTQPADGQYTWSIGIQGEKTMTTVEAKWTWKRSENLAAGSYWVFCSNECQGKKHFLHENCDLSCDKTCNGGHSFDLAPFSSYTSNYREVEDDMKRFGVSGEIEGLGYALSGAVLEQMKLTEYANDPANTYKWRSQCWNKDPCSAAFKDYDKVLFTATVTYTLMRTTTMDDGSTLVTKGPVRNHEVVLDVAVPGSMRDKAPKKVNCRCSIISDEKGEVGLLDGVGDTELYCLHGDEKHALAQGQLAQIGLTVVGEDMNKFTLTVGKPPAECEKFVIPAGWEFLCEDGSAQDTLLVEDAELITVGNTAVLASTRPSGLWAIVDVLTKQARTLCLNINKKEPSPGLKYKLVPPSDPRKVELARMTRDSRFRGPWDQVRLWIVTDRATMDEIGKVLVPGPTPRMYLRELHTVVNRHLFTIDPAKDAKIVDNKLLLAYAPDEEAIDWFVDWKMRHDKTKALSFLKANAKTLAEQFKDNKPEDAAAGVATLAGALARRGGPEGGKAAVDMLLDPALAPYRDVIVNDTHQGQVVGPLTFTADVGLANRILDLIEATKTPVGVWACQNVAPGLPQEVKDRAAKIVAEALGR